MKSVAWFAMWRYPPAWSFASHADPSYINHMVKTALSVKQASSTGLLARDRLERLGAETGAFRVKQCLFHTRFPKGAGHERDMVLKVECPGQSGRIGLLVGCKKQLSPRIALGMLESMAGPPPGASMVVFSPAISARVAEICRERNVGYLDAAGNCWLRAPGLYIERSGRGQTLARCGGCSPKNRAA
jgi:hypothetical protein